MAVMSGSAARAPGAGRPAPFQVHLDVFDGPFELLLQLIGKHKLDVTEVALAQVTDEFVAYIRAADALDLEQATSFLVVAATLLDLKAARLLPSAAVEDEDDLALLEARDLLFARLLQYRAYKQVASWMAGRIAGEERWTPRATGLPEDLAAILPEVVLGVGAAGLAEIAARVLAPRPPPVVDTAHVHAPRVSVREHMAVLAERLTAVGTASFRTLSADCRETIEVVARFLALLELFREGSVGFDQVAALAELRVRWTGTAGSPNAAGAPAPEQRTEPGTPDLEEAQ